MDPRKKTAAKKKRSIPTKAKKAPKRVKRRETPLEKLASRVSLLEEGFDELDRDLRDLRRAHDVPDAIDVAHEPAHALDEPA